jgi:hypothetical protein
MERGAVVVVWPCVCRCGGCEVEPLAFTAIEVLLFSILAISPTQHPTFSIDKIR